MQICTLGIMNPYHNSCLKVRSQEESYNKPISIGVDFLTENLWYPKVFVKKQ